MLLKDNFFFNFLQCPKNLCDFKVENNLNNNLLSNGLSFPIVENIPIIFLENNSHTKIKDWWSDLYKQLYSKFDENLNKDFLIKNLILLEDLMKLQKHLIYEEMLKFKIKNKTILEIGSGSGAHSALLYSKGAKTLAVDISFDRTMSTYKKLSLLDDSCLNFLCLNSNSENLPIKSNSFDFVYSNGVLHHANDTNKSVDEVFRVLKPGGRAILMLYCRSSSEFWLNVVPKAILFGSFFRRKNEGEWIGEVTEGKPKFGKQKNSMTRVYNRKELLFLLRKFNVQSIRKHNFSFNNFCIPRLTQFREMILKLVGIKPHDGGLIVYGRPTIQYTEIELFLSKYFGFTWNIIVEKPE